MTFSSKLENQLKRKLQEDLKVSEDVSLSKYITNSDGLRLSSESRQETLEEANGMSELHDDDKCLAFKSKKIRETNIDEIEEEIRLISLKDEVCTDDSYVMKFVEGQGEVRFSRKRSRKLGNILSHSSKN